MHEGLSFGAYHFDARADHVATVSLTHEVMLLGVGCVVLVLVLVVVAVAGAYCCWYWCCRDTAPRCEGVSESVIVTDSECSARRRLMQATLRDELRVVSWRRGISTRGLKEDLIERLLRAD